MKKSKKAISDQITLKNEILHVSTTMYVFLMFSVFLIYSPNNYADIQRDHFNFFVIITLGLLLMFIISLPIHITHIKEIKEYIFEDNIFNTLKNALKALSLTDYSILFLLLSCIISTCFSSFPKESFTGEYGRLMGLKIYLLFFVMYFLVSRGLKFENSKLMTLLITSDLMFVLALFQRLGYDFLGIGQNLSKINQNEFLSTIGNVDFFSSFVMLILPISACLFCICENDSLKIFYFISTIISFIALIISNVDSGYVATVVMFVLLGIYSFKNLEAFRKYIMVVISFLISCKIVYMLFLVTKNKINIIGTISSSIIASPIIYGLLTLNVILFFAISYFDRKGYRLFNILKTLRILFIAITSIAFITVIYLVIRFSCFDTTTNLGILGQYLRFNNQWGTGRGYIYSLACSLFSKYNPFQKLFGYGMDMFKMVIIHFTKNNTNLDSTHNELLSYLLSIGIIGCVSYISLVLSQIVKNFRNCKNEPILLAFAVCLCCYVVQSLANIAEPMVFPCYFLLLAISESVNREKMFKTALISAVSIDVRLEGQTLHRQKVAMMRKQSIIKK